MKQTILLLALLLLTVTKIYSQEPERKAIQSVDISAYSFIKPEWNSIQIPGADSATLHRFCRKVQALIHGRDRQINVLHIGGSHVQADMFSHRVRQRLDTINAPFSSPRGFIFPFSVAKTNNPTNYKVSYTGEWQAARNVQANREIALGMGGIAVYTNDREATIAVNLNPENIEARRWTFDRLRLLGYPEDEESTVRPVLFYGDTVIDSYFDLVSDTYVFELPGLSDHFTIGFTSEDDTMSTFIVNGFIPEKDVPGIIYHAIGVNGASTESYINSEYFDKELAIIMPDLIVFGIGINDAANKDFTADLFYRNYMTLLNRILDINPDCAFLFITNNDSFRRISRGKYQVNRNGLIARDVFYRLAEETGGGVWDLFEMMGGLSSMDKWQKAGLAQMDKIHFKREGYELIGDLLYDALVKLYDEWYEEK